MLGWSLAGSVAAAPPFANYGLADLTDLSYSVGTVLFYALYRALGADDFDETYRRP